MKGAIATPNGTAPSPFTTTVRSIVGARNDQSPVTVDLFGEVLDSDSVSILGFGVSPASIAAQLESAAGRPIHLRVDSPGGNVFAGVGIRNLLAAYPGDVDITVVGLAASIASVILTAGTTVSMMTGATVMVHQPWAIAAGDADFFREQANILDKLATTIVSLYQEKGKRGIDWSRLMRAETWMDPQEAIATGLVDKVERGRIAAQNAYDLSKFGYKRVPQALGGKPQSDADAAQRAKDWKRIEDVQRRIDSDERQAWLDETKRQIDVDNRRLQLDEMQRQADEVPESSIPRAYRDAVAQTVRACAAELRIPAPQMTWTRRNRNDQGTPIRGYAVPADNSIYVSWPAESIAQVVATTRHEVKHCEQHARGFTGDCEADARAYATLITRADAQRRVNEVEARMRAGARR